MILGKSNPSMSCARCIEVYTPGVEQSRQQKVLNELDTALRNQEAIADKELFATLVNESMAALHLDDGDVAGKMPVSRSAVSRWRRGLNAPLPMMRPPIYKFFAKKLRRELSKRTVSRPQTPSAVMALVPSELEAVC